MKPTPLMEVLSRMEYLSDEPCNDIHCRKCGAYYSSQEHTNCPQCRRAYCRECLDDQDGLIIFIIEQIPETDGGHSDGQSERAIPGEPVKFPVSGQYGSRKIAKRCPLCIGEIEERMYQEREKAKENKGGFR